MLIDTTLEKFELYDELMSTECYSVRLFCHLNNIGYESNYSEIKPLNVANLEPLLFDPHTDFTIQGTWQCLQHLASDQQYSLWQISDNSKAEQWLKFNKKLNKCLGKLRLKHLTMSNLQPDEPKWIRQTHLLLQNLDDHLCDQNIKNQLWIETSTHPSLLDVLVFPLVAVSYDAGIELHQFLHIRCWLRKIHQLEGFEPMPGLLA